MNIKIKTLDIDIDYTDDNSVPYEEIKRRILEISEAIVSQQLSLEQARKELQELDLQFEPENQEEYVKAAREVLQVNSKVEDPMWFVKQKVGSITKDFSEGYCQAVYQIRLYLSSLEEEPKGIRSYTSDMLRVLSDAKWKQDTDAWDGNLSDIPTRGH